MDPSGARKCYGTAPGAGKSQRATLFNRSMGALTDRLIPQQPALGQVYLVEYQPGKIGKTLLIQLGGEARHQRVRRIDLEDRGIGISNTTLS